VNRRWDLFQAAGALFAVRSVAALLLALPVTSFVASRTAPLGGEGRLFRDGGAVAIELADLARSSLSGALVGGGASLLVASLVSLSPLAVVIARLGPRPPVGFVEHVRAATRPVAGLALLFGVASVLEAFVLLVASLGLGALAFKVFGGREPREDVAALLALLASLLLVALAGIVHDLSRCALVAHGLGFYDAVARGLSIARRRLGRLFAHYVARAGAATLVLGAAALFTLRVGMGRLAVVVVVQQGALFVAASLRASWLRYVLEVDAGVPRGELEPGFDPDADDVAKSADPALWSAPSETRTPR
jgi:hypothetical protein